MERSVTNSNASAHNNAPRKAATPAMRLCLWLLTGGMAVGAAGTELHVHMVSAQKSDVSACAKVMKDEINKANRGWVSSDMALSIVEQGADRVIKQDHYITPYDFQELHDDLQGAKKLALETGDQKTAQEISNDWKIIYGRFSGPGMFADQPTL